MRILGLLISVALAASSSASADDKLSNVKVELAARDPNGNVMVRFGYQSQSATGVENPDFMTRNLLFWGNEANGFTQLSETGSYESSSLKDGIISLSAKFAIGDLTSNQNGVFLYGLDRETEKMKNEISCENRTVPLAPLTASEIAALERQIKARVIALHPLPEVYRKGIVLKNEAASLYLYLDTPALNFSSDSQRRVFVGTKDSMERGQISDFVMYRDGGTTYMTINKTMKFYRPTPMIREPATLTVAGKVLELTAVKDQAEIDSLKIEGLGLRVGDRGIKLTTPCD